MNKKFILRTCLAAAVLALLGCSTSNPEAPALNPVTGQHPATWLNDHWTAYLQNPASCSPCHGSAVDSTAAGGTSQVSCFGCHHPFGPNHPAGWADPEQHGRLGAQAVADSAQFSMHGMASCEICHGTDFKTGVGVTPSCYSCHTQAPHAYPWLGTTDPTVPRHSATDPSNAPVCYGCHAAGSANNPINPPTPAPAGTVPGCTNSTMCHGTTFS
jgi:hypothetical protein